MCVTLTRSIWLGATMLVMVAPVPGWTLARHAPPRLFSAHVQVAPQTGAATPAARLAARVVTDTDRTPIEHALVTVRVDGKVVDSTRTNADGQFDVGVPSSGDYTVVIARNGFVRTAQPASALRVPGTLEISLVRAAAVSGRVIDSAGRAIVSIRVRVVPLNGGPPVVAVTDDRGMFRVGGLAAGRYTTVAEGRPEYRSIFRSDEPLPPHVELSADPSSNSVVFDARPGLESDVALTYRDAAVILPYATVGGAVTGRIVDEFGLPAEGVTVQLWGARATEPASNFTKVGETRITDDRGEYRLFHIPAGRYVVEVTDESSGFSNLRSDTWLPVYYPGTNMLAEATPLEVGRSQELGGVDAVFARRRGARVFGSATSSSGQPFQGMLRLTPVDSGTPGPRVPVRAVSAGAGGSFEFTNIPPGEYTLRVTPSNSFVLALAADPTLAAVGTAPSARPGFSEFAIERVSTREGDAGPIALQTRGTATVSGQIVWESANTAGTKSAQLSAVAAGQGLGMIDQAISLMGVIDQNRPLQLEGLGGTMRFRATSPDGWWLKSATIGGVDAVMAPVTFSSPADSRSDAIFVLSDTAGRVEGTLRGTRGELVFDAMVVAFSTEREGWFAHSQFVLFATPEENARFTIGSLPPGSYFVVAVRGLRSAPTDDASMADLLETLIPSARRITIADRQRLTLTQRLDIVTR